MPQGFAVYVHMCVEERGPENRERKGECYTLGTGGAQKKKWRKSI